MKRLTLRMPAGGLYAVTPEREYGAEGLLAQINRFLETIKADGRFMEIYDRYYAIRRSRAGAAARRPMPQSACTAHH